jgi:hypothetical protein
MVGYVDCALRGISVISSDENMETIGSVVFRQTFVVSVKSAHAEVPAHDVLGDTDDISIERDAPRNIFRFEILTRPAQDEAIMEICLSGLARRVNLVQPGQEHATVPRDASAMIYHPDPDINSRDVLALPILGVKIAKAGIVVHVIDRESRLRAPRTSMRVEARDHAPDHAANGSHQGQFKVFRHRVLTEPIEKGFDRV